MGGATGTGGAPGTGGSKADAGPGDTATGTDALPTCSGATCSVTFVSDSSWGAYDGDPAITPSARNLGMAQPICLNATSPPSCPTGALLYGNLGTGWAFSLATIAGAEWIWGPGIAASDVADLRRFYFSRVFIVGLAPIGQITIAADDMARVVVNGIDVNGVGSVTDITLAAQSNTMLSTFDISTALHPGANTITIGAQNGPASYAGCTPSCNYAMNPAGVVFGGTLSYH
jgi:hypothetical protein